jgi:hypothetical protein
MAPATWQILMADGEERRLEVRPSPVTPRLDEAEARARAARYVPAAGRATGVQARHGVLSVVADGLAGSLKERPVWLIRFAGVPFVVETCACHGTPERATTVVALDAGSGDLVLLYGVDDDGPSA